VPLLDTETEQRIEDIIIAVASAYSVFLLGREITKPGIIGFGRPPVGAVSATQLTFLEQSYIAGKAAHSLGTNNLRRMSEKQLTDWLLQNSVQISEADRAQIEGLKNNTQKWVKGRSEAWQQKIRIGLANADRDWRAVLGAGFPDGQARALARNSALLNLRDRLRDEAAGFQKDTDRLVQSEMHHYFQQGLVAEVPGDEIVYKIPRATACKHCMRLHVNPDGSPIKHKLSEVQGNSNFGAPAFAWVFTIGPVHPWCYCLLYRELDQPAPSENKTLAVARKEELAKTADSIDITGCGIPNDPDLLFENQILKGTHKEHFPSHFTAMISAVKEIYGDEIPIPLKVLK